MDVDDHQVVGVELVGERGDGECGHGRGVAEHELDAGGRQGRVDRQVGRAGLQYRQDGHDRVGRLSEQQRHGLAGAHPAVDQQVRQPVRALVELAVGHGPALVGHRRRVRGARRLGGEQLRDGRRRAGLGQDGPVAPRVQPVVFGGLEQVDRRQPPRGVGGHGGQHPPQSFDQRRDPCRVENVCVVFDLEAHLATGLGLHRQRVVGGFAAADVGDGEFVVARQRAGVDRVVLVGEQGVEQRVLPGDAVNLVERQVLVVERVVVRALQLVEQVGGGGGGGDVRPHRHGVDQQAHHGVRAGDFGGAARHGGAEHDVALAGQPAQQLRVGGLQDGVDGGVARARQVGDGLGEVGGQRE